MLEKYVFVGMEPLFVGLWKRRVVFCQANENESILKKVRKSVEQFFAWNEELLKNIISRLETVFRVKKE